VKESLVHETAKAYRRLLLAGSYPGRRFNLDMEALEFDFTMPFSRGLMLLIYTLIDAEVSFKVVGKSAQEATRLISRLTYGRPSDLSSADFIIVLEDATEAEKGEAILKSKVGTLIDPHRSATLVMAVGTFGEKNDLVLKGPGIREKSVISLGGLEALMTLREEKNREYPMGIDMVFVDHAGLALPRTTQIERRSSSWPM